MGAKRFRLLVCAERSGELAARRLMRRYRIGERDPRELRTVQGAQRQRLSAAGTATLAIWARRAAARAAAETMTNLRSPKPTTVASPSAMALAPSDDGEISNVAAITSAARGPPMPMTACVID